MALRRDDKAIAFVKKLRALGRKAVRHELGEQVEGYQEHIREIGRRPFVRTGRPKKVKHG
jgi:hypothetical protein